MNIIGSVVTVALLGGSIPDALGDWHIWMTTSSGWAAPTGIYVDAEGRNAAYGDKSDRRLFTDRRSGVPASFCEQSPLSEYQIRKIAFRISSIPNDVLQEGLLLITGACADEFQNHITLTLRGRDHHFGYSQEKHCRNGRDVPDWLIGLVSA